LGQSPTEAFLSNETESEILQTIEDGLSRTNEESLFNRKDGNLFPVQYSTKAIFERDKIVGAVVTFTDITERKKTEEIMLKSEKLSITGKLAAGIAPEIRNPLTSIKGFLQMIEAGYQKEEYIEIMSKELNLIELIVSE
jgi:signal transduction histidine kinase